MTRLAISPTQDGISAGEAYLSHTPALESHKGAQPDLFIAWNRTPFPPAAVDVVVHLHGFSQQGPDMPLAEKVARSGLDLSGRTRPTIALLPRGNWIRHYYYDFPALLSGGIDRLIEAGLQYFVDGIAAASPGMPVAPKVDRFILTAHSGGGMPAIDAIAGARRPPDELYIFDGLYGGDPATGDPLLGLEIIDRWLGERLQCEPERQGALRVIYIEQQTGPFSRALGELITRRLGSANPALAESLARRYRIEPSGVQHSQIAHYCAPALLAAADAQFEWWR
jgi:hypothetical protein